MQARTQPNAPVLVEERALLSTLPGSERYTKSFMHRDTVVHVDVSEPLGFVMTASVDGHVKFWKKQLLGIEFAKDFRVSTSPVVATSVSADGACYATASAGAADSANTVKIFDVATFDMTNMLRLDFAPLAIAWVHARGQARQLLAV